MHCPDGFIQHLYRNECMDDNECAQSPCGTGTCYNTYGSYRCGCPDGYQFDTGLSICIQVSAGCAGSPCAFGCTSLGGNSFQCGCPSGYQRIGQINGKTRHRRSLRKSLALSMWNSTLVNNTSIDSSTRISVSKKSHTSVKPHHKKRSLHKRRKVRHHHDEQMFYLKLSLAQTKHRMRIVKLQPAIKVSFI
ncbi:Fibrillin-2 [Blattella germanica]|nr:Fibrillin-2 [Blattella germanica]